MKRLTLVIPYYDNPKMLEKHFENWKKYDEEVISKFKVILVDDGSPNYPAIDYIQKTKFKLQLFRIKQNIPWNQHGAKNLGMTHAKKGWCLMTDIDHLLLNEDAKKIINYEWDNTLIYMPQRVKCKSGKLHTRHPNTFLLTKRMFWNCGGYDEAFAGYYGTDAAFRRRLRKFTKIVETDVFKMVLFGKDDIPDASTTDFGRHGTKYKVGNNPKLKIRKKEAPEPIPPLNFNWKKLI